MDLCCGYGRHALYLCEQGIRVTACDNDPAVIENLRAEAKRFSALDADVCDMRELPYGDNAFDAVICYSALHHQRLRQLEESISEVRRVCRKGAVFSFDILSRNDVTCGVGEQIEPFTYVGGRAGEEDVPHHYVSEAELMELLRGFDRIQIREVTYRYVINHQLHTSVMFCAEAVVGG